MLQEGVRAVMPILLAVLLGGLSLFRDELWPVHMTRLQVPLSADFETVESCVASNGPQVIPGLKLFNGGSETRGITLESNGFGTSYKMGFSPAGATYLSVDGSFKLSLRPARSGNEMVIRSTTALTNKQSALFRRCATSPLKVI